MYDCRRMAAEAAISDLGPGLHGEIAGEISEPLKTPDCVEKLANHVGRGFGA